MKPGTRLRQRDLILIPIPFTDLSSKKRRPVIVLSNDDYNSKTQDILVVGVTSLIQGKEYSVPLEKEDMEEGELLRESEIRADKIYSLSQEIVVKRFGRIKGEVFREVVDRINDLIKTD
jgi:mRNA interferase MazF